jgi:hypothetical protein
MEAPNQAAAETIRIYVRPLYHDAILRLDVEGSDTIESVKGEDPGMEGIPPKHQRLICCGKNLTNGRTLTDCDVENGSKLFVVSCRVDAIAEKRVMVKPPKKPPPRTIGIPSTSFLVNLVIFFHNVQLGNMQTRVANLVTTKITLGAQGEHHRPDEDMDPTKWKVSPMPPQDSRPDGDLRCLWPHDGHQLPYCCN